LRDADDGLGPHPSNSRHGSLLSAAGLAARENEHALRSSSRRSPAAHTKRSMSRAALAEEKIRLLDGIGGYAPHGSVPSRRDGASSSSSRGWGFGKYAPSAGQAVLACALVAMVVAVAAFPEIVTAGRYALSGTIARAIAARHRINTAVDEPQPGASASSSASETPAAELAGESCVRLVAGDAGVSSELLALVHAAKRLQKQGKRVVWDYANAAATCPCGDVSSRSKDDEDATTRASSARRLLRLSASSPGASLCVSGASARETNNGWTAMFASASDAFTDASAESDDSACRTALPRKAREAIDTEAPNEDEDADSLLVVGARNAMCESVLGAWVLTPAIRAEVAFATKSLGGDLARVVAFHVGDEKETGTSTKSARAITSADVEKEVRRLAAFVRERAESTHADASSLSSASKVGWAEKAARYEEEVKAEEEAIEEAGAEGSAASEKTEKTETTEKKRASVESSKRSSKTASKKPAGGEGDEGVRAYVASAIHDLAAGQGGGEGDARLAKPPRDEPTLMDQFASWLRRRDAEASSPAGKKASRRLLTVTTDADAGRVAAEKLMRAGSVFESAEDVPPVNPEDLSLLERVGERFESFKLELAGAAAARGNAGEEEKEARDRFEDTKASVAAEIARAAEKPGSLEDVARLSGEKGWRCVILGADAKMARRVASALEEADAPCAVVDRVSSRAFSSAAEGPFASRAASSRCASTVADIVDAELAAGAARAVVAAPAAGARVAALLQQCREDRLDMVDWAGLGVHELSVSAALDA
jgi:hypothetical protein